MGSHPANLAFRFLLEVAALIAVGRWGFHLVEAWPRYLLAIAIPVGLAVLWGTFAVPKDPSRSGNAPVPISRSLRLCLELVVFGPACWRSRPLALAMRDGSWCGRRSALRAIV